MTFPNLPPGVIFPPITALEQRITALEAKLDAVSRRDMTNAVVGQGGTFRATLEVGGVDVLSIKPGLPQYGSKQQMALRDGQGNAMYRTDELAGYGLSAPRYTYPMGVTFEGSNAPTNAAGVEVKVAECSAPFYNPAVYARALVTTPNGLNWTYRFIVTDGVTSVNSTVSSVSNSQYVQKSLLLPPGFMDNQSTKLQLLITPATASPFTVFPGTCEGTTKAFYDAFPSGR